MQIQVKRSDRKTLSLEVRPDGSVLVRAPLAASQRDIESFVREHEDWIRQHVKKMEQRRQAAQELGSLTREDIERLGEEACRVIPERVRYYAPKVGVTYGRITIRNQTTKWGSCSGKGNLNFNCLLMLMPREVLDYVVVHELAHRKEMNHSPAFWAIVGSVLPNYRESEKWLKENGGQYIQMMQNGLS